MREKLRIGFTKEGRTIGEVSDQSQADVEPAASEDSDRFKQADDSLSYDEAAGEEKTNWPMDLVVSFNGKELLLHTEISYIDLLWRESFFDKCAFNEVRIDQKAIRILAIPQNSRR